MTVEQLVWELLHQPGNANVRVAISPSITDVGKIDKCVDIDTNVASVVIYGKEEAS